MNNSMKKTVSAVALAFVLFRCGAVPNATNVQPDYTSKGGLPRFELENVAGGTTKSSDLQGKVLVIDFWATWCDPCLSEIPKYNRIADEYKGKNVEIIGVAVESKREDIVAKVKDMGIKYPILVGNDKIVDNFGGIVGWPTTFIITKDRKIYGKYIGATANKEQRLKSDIDKLLAD
jgi:thiol-disulfide isomerase/thioredoxin